MSAAATKLRMACTVICEAGNPARSIYTCVARTIATPIQKDHSDKELAWFIKKEGE